MVVGTLLKINAFLLEILFPRNCLQCRKPGTYFCCDCARQLCHEGRVFRDEHLTIISCTTLTPLLKRIIHYFKYYFATDLAMPLGLILQHQFKKHFNSDNIVIVPVPLHKKRQKYRSFNQSELLARILGTPTDLLKRVKHTKPQAKLNRESRLKNLQNAFTVTGEAKGKIIVLIDDVCTTGATLSECAKVLANAGAKEIFGLVIARG